VPAASTVAEATVAYTVANEFLRRYGGDTVPALRRHIEADRDA
jgi:chorismate synthase